MAGVARSLSMLLSCTDAVAAAVGADAELWLCAVCRRRTHAAGAAVAAARWQHGRSRGCQPMQHDDTRSRPTALSLQCMMQRAAEGLAGICGRGSSWPPQTDLRSCHAAPRPSAIESYIPGHVARPDCSSNRSITGEPVSVCVRESCHRLAAFGPACQPGTTTMDSPISRYGAH